MVSNRASLRDFGQRTNRSLVNNRSGNVLRDRLLIEFNARGEEKGMASLLELFAKRRKLLL